MELPVICMCFGLLIHLPPFGCVDLHLSGSIQPGATLANVSIGPEWTYRIDRSLTDKSLRHFVKIGRSDGLLSVARKVDCTRLPRNPVPLYLRIKSLLSENFILLHFNTFVHGQNCFIKYKRKNLNPDAYMYLLTGYETCFSLDSLPINIYERLPVSLRNSQMFRGRCVAKDQQLVISLTGANLCLPHKQRDEANLLCLMPNSLNSSLFVDVKLHLSRELDPWAKRQKRNVNSAPQFQLPNYQVSVPENEPSGTRVITLKAFDADDGDAGVIEYDMEALFDSRSNNLFQINPETGGITTLQPLDREVKDTHVFKVTATDRGTPKRSAIAYLTITVSDTNDHAPVFEQNEYRVSIRENVEVGFEVMTIRATDGDAPSNANMIYKIVNGDEVNTFFEIDPRNGLVKTRVRPDREVKTQYKLFVEANDQGREPGPRTATATVHILIEDENDNYPQFSEKRYVVQVPENIAVNSQVAVVKATDKDAGNNAKVHYSIINGNIKGQFYIHSPTGVIDVISPLDYEMMREYTLRVKAQDGGRPPLINGTGMVVIQVLDINDNAPMFVSTPFQASVLENVPVGYSVLHIQAIDADSGYNAHLEYMLTDTSPSFPFIINNNTGWITVSAELDRETTEFYNFGVEARDHGVPTMSSSASVSITILDVNDNVPTFTQHLYNLKVNEDAVVGTSVLTVTAVDRDVNSMVTYQISSGNTRNRFAITSQSGGGLITLALPLDYKQERQYLLTITASDGTRHDTAQVFINVTDANTHRPVFQSANYQVLVSEDRPVGSTVVVISATDEDTGENARITYVMEDNVPQFKIDPDTGAITTLIEIDYEDQASYTLAIIARDNGIPQKSDTTYVEIIVLDANDNAPQFLRDIYQGTVFEDAPVYTSVLQVSASDRDSGSNGRLSYTFQGGDDGEGDFFIEPYSGIIRTARKLDRENVALYNLKAFAVDKGVPPLKAAVDIHVSVLDINDNAPVFEKDELYFYVEENSAVGSTLARVSATDPDEGTNAQILYQIVEGNIPEVFQLDIFSGDLIALTDLDFETKMEYVIVVQATSAPLVSRATVHVLLVDVNDNVPVLQDFEIIFNNYITNKSSSFPTGVIGKVPARDPDVSDKLLYTFLEGNELKLLILNQDTGELKLSKDLDNNRPLEATMRVTVSGETHMIPHYLATVSLLKSSQLFGLRLCAVVERFPKSPLRVTLLYQISEKSHFFECHISNISAYRCIQSCAKGNSWPKSIKTHFLCLPVPLFCQTSHINKSYCPFGINWFLLSCYFFLGETKTTVTPVVAGGVSDGQWHRVHLHYYNKVSHFMLSYYYVFWPNIGRLGIPHGPSEEKVAVVAVDECDVAMALRFGGQIGNYSCAARGTQTGQKKSLDLTGPLLLGGVPNLPEDFPVQNQDFVGCIRNLTIDSKPIDMASFISNNGTLAGCAAKHDFCSQVVCQNGGVCVNRWNTHTCNCPLGYGGKNCEHVMPAPLHFDGHALVSWSETDITIAIPWYMGLMFRTRKSTGVLLQASAGDFSKISLMVSLVFLGVRRVALLDFPQVCVDNGEWHHVLVELKSGKDGKDIKYMALVSLDYGMFQMTVEIGNELPGLKLRNLFIGGLLKKDGTVQAGFTGCMQGVRMGETSTNTGNINIRHATRIRVKDGCNIPDVCQSSLCPSHSRCADNWASHTCICEPGYFGRDCVDACLLNPCEYTSSCVRKPSTKRGYSCECGHNYYGQYCEHKGDQPCAHGWWGYPTCGPCNCDVSKGFKRDCNKTTGECSCKDNYFRPLGADTCYPCDCFPLGAHSRTCDPVTGQCPCKMGVVGRQCNRCDNPFAEVTVGGCVVVYDGCPKAFEDGIWWPRTMFGGPAATNCPKGSSGTAIRHCSDDKGWFPPELFNCTSLSFSKLKKESEDLHANASRMDGERSKSLAGLLHSATDHTARLFGNDVRTAYHLLASVLEHESLQQGFELTATHDADFNKNIIKAGSAIFDPVNKEHWEKIQRSDGGTAHLLHHFEEYANTLVQNMRKTYLRPFTIVTDNMIVALDFLGSTANQDKIPRFQEVNEVYSEELESSVLFPNLPKKSTGSQIEPTESFISVDGSDTVDLTPSIKKRRHAEQPDPPAVVMVMIYRSLGGLLPESYDPDRRSLRLPTRPVINTPVVSVVVHSDGEPLPTPLQRPITLNFRLLETHERTKPVCVYWNHSIPVSGGGAWSSKGCELVFRNSTHISCQCNHMTSFAVLMDISKREHGDVLPLKVVTYTTVSASLVALLITFLLLAILHKLRSNLHSIHKNLVAAIFLSELIFLTGINQTDSPFVCTVVAILLHYSYMCAFAWMFVEGLHIYRMLTEMRNINQGHMRFYYAIGWGIPAVITGLAVGLDPQGYGNADFCWLSVYDTLIWSITGPIAIVVLVILIVLAAKASCGRRQRTEKSGAISALRVAFLLLLLISATWLLGLMAVNSDVLSFHYLFAILSCLQGICIFFFHCILNKDVRRNLKSVFTGKKVPVEDPSTTRATLLTRSLNGDVYTEDGGLYRTTIGEYSVSLESSIRSGKSHGSSYLVSTLREKKRSISSNGGNVGHDEGDSSLFFHKSKKAEDSDSDSELSVDEHSSSCASSHSSDSEDEARHSRTKWNNERTPVHSTPKADAVSGQRKPYWLQEPPTASESEEPGGPEKLRVETKVNVELHQGNKLNHNGDVSQSESSPSQPNSNQLPRRGILKNKITYPPPLTDKNMKNRLREKLSDYNPAQIPRKTPSLGSNEGVRSGTEATSIIIKPPPLPPQSALNGMTVELGTSPLTLGSNETSI
uniref:Cadherin EGF LAG seven-pass G-type receptor 1b n=1 Tax=Cyprinus carpio TaxID=7962 RepID=A0A8C2GGK0_CYPCA